MSPMDLCLKQLVFHLVKLTREVMKPSGGGAFLGERGSTALGVSCLTPAPSLCLLSAASSYPHVSPAMPSLI